MLCRCRQVREGKVELKQDGANIAARISDAGYILPTETFNADYLKNMVYRDDMNAMRARWMSDQDPNVNPRFYNQTIKLPSSTGGGYGVGQLTIRRTDLPSVNFANSARAPALGGTLKITANARARRMGIGAFSDANTTLDINGIWETGDSNSGQSTQIKGTGGTLAIVGETLGHENPCDSYFPNFVTTTASSVDNTKSLATAVGLQHTFFELTNLPPCYIWGPQMMPLKDAPNSIATPLHWRFYTNDVRSAYATVQMQGSNSVGMIRCVILKFQQSTYDLNVSIVTNLGCYTPGNGGNGYYGMDFENLEGFTGVYGYKKNTNATVPSPFSISNLVCQFSRPGEYLVTINASNQMSNARLVVAGKPDGTRIKANMNYTSRFPKNGEVEIRDGGTVVISVGSDGPNATWQNGTASIKVLSGGILRTYGNVQDTTSNTNKHTGKWALKRGQRMDLLGGEFFPAWLHSTSAQHCFCYLNNLTLADGAQVECDIPFWVGNAGSTEAYNWRVRGTSPSTIDSPVQFLGTGTTGWFEFKIDVADVAEGTDFFMTKPITRYSSTSLTNIRIGKFGPGTMEIQDTIDVIKGVYIYGGAFRLAGSHLTDASAQKFALSGGTLEAADGTANVCGPLAITARGGKIKLGVGAKLTFADSSAETWEPTEKVTVEGFAEGAIRFGTSNAAVPRQLMFKRPDGKLWVNRGGYVTAIPPGTNIAIR